MDWRLPLAAVTFASALLTTVPLSARTAVEAKGASHDAVLQSRHHANQLPQTIVSWFLTPSGNIGCMAYSGNLRCDIAHKTWRAPVSSLPRCAMGVRGDSLQMTSSGRPYWPCHSDTVLAPPGSKPALSYGATWRGGAFTCTSRISGLTCTNRRGHGFFLSRQSYRLF